jgi:PKHD-type hydroxylase
MDNKEVKFYLEQLLYEKIFTPEECDRIIELSAKFPEDDAALGYQGIDYQKRNSKSTTIRLNKDTAWIQQKIKALVQKLNNQYFKYDLEMFEDLQLLKYKEEGHFHWHNDVSAVVPFSKRKLSLIIFLSDCRDYEGGQLELMSLNINTVPMEKGYMVLFPSFKTHRVTPVTRGVRYTLVSWARSE